MASSSGLSIREIVFYRSGKEFNFFEFCLSFTLSFYLLTLKKQMRLKYEILLSRVSRFLAIKPASFLAIFGLKAECISTNPWSPTIIK
jgi:hypothetical protein